MGDPTVNDKPRAESHFGRRRERAAARSLAAAAAVLGLAACGVNYHIGPQPGEAPASTWPPQNQKPAPKTAASSLPGPLLDASGACTGTASATAAAIEPGIGECDLVRLKGKPPTDVLLGESGKGGREVQVLYAEPGGKELYFFVDNRLDRIVR
jgi:hypothetical protein